MEITIVWKPLKYIGLYLGNIGVMEKKMETAIVCWVVLGDVPAPEPTLNPRGPLLCQDARSILALSD